MHKKTKRHARTSSSRLLYAAGFLLAAVVALVASGAPRTAFAWTIYISPSYTPVVTGGYTTISWYATAAQQCTLVGPTLPTCFSGGRFGPPGGGKYCYQAFYGTTGSISTGPINSPTTYTISCYSPPGCSWWCYSGNGYTSFTVTPTPPTPTTLTAFSASPASIMSGAKSTLSWGGTKGTSFSACRLSGGQWGSGAWFSALPGSTQTSALTQTTTYQIQCFDTTGASTPTKNATVTVTAPLGPCNDIPTSPTVPNGCVTPTPAPGACIPVGGSYSSTANQCTCPAGKHVSGNACVPNPLCGNGLADSYAPSCTCPAGKYQPLGGSSCVTLPTCSNGLGISYSPSCTCPSGQVQSGASCIAQGVINSLTANPTRVRKGNTAVITWSTANMASCALKGPSVTAGGIVTLSAALSSTLNVTIASQSTYTLSCVDNAGTTRSQSITINLVPETIEQ